ncbi:hypothetical protein MKD41_01695 [Lutibacter sp. A64]|uniref:hypothetical protein n=1 Tax=Lutibacter sp. A64 TaxID=2918526 RepID=UPI001F069B7C|nr:hypothetical protein [Lutibacter sp. A64]UMB54204.1 hypothetical protein MKD41_01695 [Lutibacter sp. A64]
MPLAVVFLGIAGAFVTMSMGSTESLSTTQGYRFVSQADPCHAEQMCTTVYQPTICTSGSSRLWGKVNPSVNVCNVPLYKINN